MKKCVKCGITKELDQFGKAKSGKMGLHPRCRKCRSEDSRSYYLTKNKDAIKLNKENNIIADHGDWLEIDVSTNKRKSAVMKIDKCDWPIEGVANRIHATYCGGNTMYALVRHNGKMKRVHRLIVRTDMACVDHINHDGLDNRRENLRACSKSENVMNSIVRSDNTSGVRGVKFVKKLNKWCAFLYIDGIVIVNKTRDSKEEAIKIRRNAELKYFGDFEYTKSINEQEK